MAALRHVHSYVRVGTRKSKEKDIFQCDHPDCTHFTKRMMLTNKRILCAKCHKNEFIANWEDLKRKIPLCPDCSKTNDAMLKRVAGSIMERIAPESSNNKDMSDDDYLDDLLA